MTEPARNRIGLMVPTRGRPALFDRFVRSAIQTAADPSRIEIHTYIDQDDPSLANYGKALEDLQASFGRLGITFAGGVGNPIGCPRALNELGCASKTDIVLTCNDDQVFATDEWDSRLDAEAAKFPDGVFLLWFRDGLESDARCCFPIVSRRWIELLQYYMPTLFEHFFADFWLFDIALRIGRAHYVPDVEVTHVAAWAGLAPKDETAERTRGPLSKGRFARDEIAFRRLERYRELDAGILRAALLPSDYEAEDGHPVGAPRLKGRRDEKSATLLFPIDPEYKYDKTIDLLLA